MGIVKADREQSNGHPRHRSWGEWGKLRMKKGFTLIELLVVIAIIGILAAIIFPVFARAKNSAYKSSDLSNMNAIRTALQLYKADQGAYPPSLLGYATLYNGQAQIPANQLIGALYPKRIDSLETLRPAYNRATNGNFNSAISQAVWPNKAASGTANGTSNQRYGPTDGPVLGCRNGSATPNYYYLISGYDVATVPDGSGGKRVELHYAPFWSGWTVAADPCNPIPSTTAGGETGSASDDPRQLGYSDPPDTTVVTWDSYFRDYTNGVPDRVKNDIVLFLGGSARPYDSSQVWAQSWKVLP